MDLEFAHKITKHNVHVEWAFSCLLGHQKHTLLESKKMGLPWWHFQLSHVQDTIFLRFQPQGALFTSRCLGLRVRTLFLEMTLYTQFSFHHNFHTFLHPHYFCNFTSVSQCLHPALYNLLLLHFIGTVALELVYNGVLWPIQGNGDATNKEEIHTRTSFKQYPHPTWDSDRRGWGRGYKEDKESGDGAVAEGGLQ